MHATTESKPKINGTSRDAISPDVDDRRIIMQAQIQGAGKWVQDPANPRNTDWNITENVTYGHVHEYHPEALGGGSCCWQAVRNRRFRLSGIVSSVGAAQAEAERILALPKEEFNRLVVEDLMNDIKRLERDILALAPEASLLPGYQAGFEAGAADMKRKVAAALEIKED